MGLTSITPGGIVAPTSPEEVMPSTSTTSGGFSTLASATGGEVALLSTAPRGGVAVCASSGNASPTTVGSADLIRDGEARAPRSSCGTTTGLQVSNITSIQDLKSKQKKIKSPRFYLAETGIRSFGLKIRGLIAAGIFACVAAAVHCASKPRRRASSDVFTTSSRCLLAAGLSDLLTSQSLVTDNS
jgi:hypothetical protein